MWVDVRNDVEDGAKSHSANEPPPSSSSKGYIELKTKRVRSESSTVEIGEAERKQIEEPAAKFMEFLVMF